jgi:hypothetical protein
MGSSDVFLFLGTAHAFAKPQTTNLQKTSDKCTCISQVPEPNPGCGLTILWIFLVMPSISQQLLGNFDHILPDQA